MSMTWDEFNARSKAMSFHGDDSPYGFKPHIIPAPRGRWFAKRLGEKTGVFGDSPSTALKLLTDVTDSRSGASDARPCRHNPLGQLPQCDCLRELLLHGVGG